MNTVQAFDRITAQGFDIFQKKYQDYGASWRVLRASSLTDQIFIKAKRIRQIQEIGTQKVAEQGDDIPSEFLGIINYSVMALMQLQEIEEKENVSLEEMVKIGLGELKESFQNIISQNRTLLSQKNHDYGEAWRDMRVSSMTDLILQKLFRIKQIEDNQGKTEISEGIAAGYRDIINYAVFCLIKSDYLKDEDS